MFHENKREKKLKNENFSIAMICPNDRRFKGSNLSRYLSELNNPGFKKVTLLIANGCLEKKSIASKFDEKDITKKIEESNERMIKWKKAELKKIKQYKNISFREWDELIETHPNYNNFKKHVKSIYSNNKDFKKNIDLSIKYYLKKYFPNHKYSEESLNFKNCLEYKLTEVTGLLVKKELGFKFLAYPGTLCPGLEYALEEIINKEGKELKFVKINIKKKEHKNITTELGLGMFKKLEHTSIIAMLDIELKSCRTPKEGMLLLTQIQSLTLKYMAQYTKSAESKESIEEKKGFTVKQDGGINYI